MAWHPLNDGLRLQRGPGERTALLGPWLGVIADRLARLPTAVVLGRELPVARGARARLLGLAGLDRERAGVGLLIPRCASVHTFGMRFALDLVFLDGEGRICAVRRGVAPRRVVFAQGAAAVLELPAAQGGEFSLAGT